MGQCFSYFLQFKSEFGNKEFIIWATVSSWSCFHWLYKASPSLAAKNIISLILVLTIWWCPCVESSLVLLEEGVCYDQCILLAKLCYLWPASFCTPRPNLPVIPGISWLPTFAYQSPIMKRTSFGGVSSKRFVTLYSRQWSRPSPRKRNAKRQNGCMRNPEKSVCRSRSNS